MKAHITLYKEQGAYGNLVLGLRGDPQEFEKFHRINAHHFDLIMGKILGAITRVDTTFRPAISAAEAGDNSQIFGN